MDAQNLRKRSYAVITWDVRRNQSPPPKTDLALLRPQASGYSRPLLVFDHRTAFPTKQPSTLMTKFPGKIPPITRRACTGARISLFGDLKLRRLAAQTGHAPESLPDWLA